MRNLVISTILEDKNMLTTLHTLNALWNKDTSSDHARIKEIFANYAKPTFLDRLVHWKRTTDNQNAVTDVLQSQDSENSTPEKLLAEIHIETSERNPEGELQHRINFVSDKMGWAVTAYPDDNKDAFLKIIDDAAAAIEPTEEEADGIQGKLESVKSDNERLTNRVVITPKGQPTSIVGIAYVQGSDFNFVQITPKKAPAAVPVLE